MPWHLRKVKAVTAEEAERAHAQKVSMSCGIRAILLRVAFTIATMIEGMFLMESVMRGTLWLAIGLMVTGFGVGAKVVRAEHYEVFVLAGQSNMDGRAPVTGLTGELGKWKEPQKDVVIAYSDSTLRGRYLTSGGWKVLEPGYSVAPTRGEKITKVPAGTFGPEVSFGRTMAEAMKREHIALVKFAEGGTSLKKNWEVGKKGKLYDQMMQFVAKSLGELKARGDTYEVKGFVWHQGESDADLKESEGEYAGLLKGLIKRVREDLQPYRGKGASGELPVVIGEVFDNGKRDSIIAAQKEVAKELPGCRFAPSAELKTKDKGTHFDAASQIEMGKRMGEAMLGLLNRDGQ